MHPRLRGPICLRDMDDLKTLPTEDAAIEDWRAGGFSLYVHWPFCASKCPYCDFNSHVVDRVDQSRWLAAYEVELARLAAELPHRSLQSVFFGGGTPSLMQPETVDGILAAARRAWRYDNDIEITLEANPTSVETGRFDGFAQAGVNRVSLGVQALNDADLKRLGRLHSAAEARDAFDIARRLFPRVSFDLIYARQDQDRAAWRSELQEALGMAADHLSLYQLTIEPGTAFGTRHAAGGLRGLPGEDLAADLYEDTQALCDKAGLPAYEISNHACPGGESRHNLCYWRQGDWAAIGPGAHGRITRQGMRYATEAASSPGAWLAKVEAEGCGDVGRIEVSREEQLTELLLMGMRLVDGVPLARLRGLGFMPDENRLAEMIDHGAIEIEDGVLRPTRSGRLILNEVLRLLTA